MRRYCQLIRLRPEHREEYIEYHKAGLADGPRARLTPVTYATTPSTFKRDLLIAYFEYHGSDYVADMRKMAADPETQRWWSIMDPMQQPLPAVQPGWQMARDT